MNKFTQKEKKQLKHLWASTAVKILNHSHDVILYKKRDILEALEHLRMVVLILEDEECREVK